jgi:signal transduction histidine kinase
MGLERNNADIEALPEGSERLQGLLNRIADLEAQVVAQGQLLSIAAQEMRNPIHGIVMQVGAVQEMAEARGDRAIADRLAQTDKALRWFLKRCTLLLDISRLATGLQQLELGVLDLRDVLRLVEELYLPQSQLNKAAMQLECEGDLVGRWDNLALEQAFGNLVSNAVKFGAGAPVLITAKDAGHNLIKVQVSDRGGGISQADQEMMLADFTDVMQHADPEKEGFGSGLWLARNLLEAHGGYLEVASFPGSGTTFTAYLPRISSSIKSIHGHSRTP